LPFSPLIRTDSKEHGEQKRDSALDGKDKKSPQERSRRVPFSKEKNSSFAAKVRRTKQLSSGVQAEGVGFSGVQEAKGKEDKSTQF